MRAHPHCLATHVSCLPDRSTELPTEWLGRKTNHPPLERKKIGSRNKLGTSRNIRLIYWVDVQ